MHVLDSVWETLTKEFDAARLESAQSARVELVNGLNQIVRRLRAYATEAEWSAAVIDGVSQFASEAALFRFLDGQLLLLAERKLDLPSDWQFPAAEAGAFANAIGAKDPITALRTPSEVGEPLSSSDGRQRAHIFPIFNGPRVAALLFTAGPAQPDLEALEFMAQLASLVLERRSNQSLHLQIEPASAPPAVKESAETSRSLPAWADLDEQQRALHLQAQRFARVKVAEMQLFKPEACRSGREQSNFYVFLRPEIDAARELYRRQFMTSRSMVDYLHLELVRAAVDGHEPKLGVDYPGPLL